MSHSSLACPECETPVPADAVQISGFERPFQCPGCGEIFPRHKLKTHHVLRTALAGVLPPETMTFDCKLTADQTFNSTTPANVVGLVFNLQAGSYYLFRFILVCQCPTYTTRSQVGLSLSFTKPATTIFATMPSDTYDVWDDQGLAATNFITIYEGMIVPSGAGNLQLQAANTNGTAVVTIKQGSAAILTRLA